MKLIARLAFLLVLSPAAAPAATPFDLYAQGKYEQAVAAGLKQNTAAGFALAARAELAREMMREDPCLECLRRAETDARNAIAADPKEVEARIYLAATLGYEARIEGTVAAKMKGYAEKAKQQVDAAIAIDPKDAWAWAALGGWNIEIVRGGGRALARLLYDASVPDGLESFKKAFALAPQNLVLRYQYALALGGYDRDEYRGAIMSALSTAVSARPQTAYETFAQARAKALLDALNAGDTATFDRLVRHDQGYP